MRVLEDIRIIDLSQMIAAPYCTQVLGDLGADVIKVEQPDFKRDGFSPAFERDGKRVTVSGVFLGQNRNKRSVELNLKAPGARAVLVDLLLHADVVVENCSLHTRTALGIDEEWGWSIKRDLIWASLTSLGRTGPEAHRNGLDYNAQARSGWMSITGDPDGPPMKAGNSLSDYYAGLHLGIGILAALRHRERTGEGQLVDVSLLESVVPVLDGFPFWTSAGGPAPRRSGHLHPLQIPSYSMFRCRDGEVVIGAFRLSLERLLCDVIRRPDLLEAPDITDLDAYRPYSKRVSEVIQEWVGERTREEVMSTFESHRVPVEAVRDIAEIWSDPQLAARGMFWEYDYEPLGKIKAIGSPIHLSRTPPDYRLPPPLCGQHTSEVLEGLLGYDEERIAQLAMDGAFELEDRRT